MGLRAKVIFFLLTGVIDVVRLCGDSESEKIQEKPHKQQQ